MAEETHDWGKHKKLYMMVGIALFICTGLTLALGLVKWLDFGPPGPTPADYVFGLAVAVTKASLVAVIFMHLNHERGLIYKTLVFTMLFAIGMMSLIIFAEKDPVKNEFGTLESTSGKLTEFEEVE